MLSCFYKTSSIAILWLCLAGVFPTEMALAAESLAAGNSATALGVNSAQPAKNLSRSVKPAKKKPTTPGRPKDLLKSISRVWDFQASDTQELPKFWEPLSGTWVVKTEPEHPANQVIRQTVAKKSFQYLLSRGQLVNFEFSARMRVDSSEQKPSNWQMGLVLRWANEHCYYKYRISAANVALVRCSPANTESRVASPGSSQTAVAAGHSITETEQVLMLLPMSNALDQWHTLSAACYGERISLKLDGREVRMVDDSVIGSGRVGVFSHKAQVFIDDLRLYYLPVLDMRQPLLLTREIMTLGQNHELLAYYRNDLPGNLEIRILDPAGRLFSVLTQGYHAAGLGSVAWNGQGLNGKSGGSGWYTLELKAGKKKKAAKVFVGP